MDRLLSLLLVQIKIVSKVFCQFPLYVVNVDVQLLFKYTSIAFIEQTDLISRLSFYLDSFLVLTAAEFGKGLS